MGNGNTVNPREKGTSLGTFTRSSSLKWNSGQLYSIFSLLSTGYYLLPIALFLLPFLVVGCLNPFAPPLDKTEAEAQRIEPTTPEAVLQNFKSAYENRDINLYLDCLDRDFAFCYFDNEVNHQKCYGLQDGDVPGEKRRTEMLFSIYERITLEPWQILSSYLSSDSLETRRVLFNLLVEDMDGTYPTSEAEGYALFKFVQQEERYYIVLWNDQSISPGELWK